MKNKKGNKVKVHPRIGAGILVGVLVVSVAFSDQIAFGLKSLREMSEKASLQVSVDQMEAKVLEDKIADANKLAKERQNAGGTRDENLQRDITVKVDTLVANQNAALQKLTSNENAAKRRIDLETATIELFLVKEQLKAMTLNTTVFDKEIALVKKQYQLGQVTALQVLEKENALLTHKQDLIALEQQVYQKSLELERLVGEPLKGAIAIDFKLLESPMPEPFTLESIGVVVARQLSVIKAQNTFNEKQLTFDLTDIYYDPTDKEYKSIAFDLEVAKYDLKSAKETEEIAIVYDYQQLDLLKQAYQLEKENVTLTNERLLETQKRLKLGTATALDVLKGEMQLRNKRVDAQKALGAYEKAVLLFGLK